MDYKKMQELGEYLGLEYEDLNEELKSLNVIKAIDIYERVKAKSDVKTAVNMLYTVLQASGLGVSKEIIENLSLDDEFRDYALTLQTTKNKVVASVLKVLKEEKNEDDVPNVVIDEDIDDDVEEKTESSGRGLYGIFGALPKYTEEEEKTAFQKYDYLKMRLELHLLYARRFNPDIEKFIEYAENCKSEDRYGNAAWAQSKDPMIVKAISKLYSTTTTREEVLNARKDQEIVDLVEEMKEVRDDISAHNMRLVMSIARRYKNCGLPEEDLIQEGTIGLDKAINKFDPSLGNKFSTFAVPWITQAVTRAVSNEGTTIRIPVHLSQKATGIKRAMNALLVENEIEREDASPEEICRKCKELGYEYTVEDVKKFLKAIIISQPVSADKPVGEEEDNTLIDFLTSDNYEKPETYAESREALERLDIVLDELGTGKTSYSKRIEYTHNYYFKQLIIQKDDTKEVISIILTNGMNVIGRGDLDKDKQGEYKYYFGKGGRERQAEFYEKYGLDPRKITLLNTKDLTLSKAQREEFVFKLRFGLTDPLLEKFVKGRNYNNALFDENDRKEKEVDKMTLAQVGKLFDITRERVRQIEAKFRPKVAHALGKRPQKITAVQHIYLDENFKQNIYDTFNIYIPKRKDYIPIIPRNNIVDIDDYGNITPLKVGSVTICLKHTVTNIGRELQLIVHPALRESISNYVANKNKMLELKPEDNKKDNQ